MRSVCRAIFAVSLFVWFVSIAVAQSTYSFTPGDLGTLGGTYSDGRGVNNSGQVTGCSTTSAGASHAYVWSPPAGPMIDLDTLPGGTYSCGVAINDSGQVTGYSDVNGSGGNAHAFLYTPANGMVD